MEAEGRRLQILLLTKDDCALCDDAKGMLQRLADDFPIEVTTLELSTQEGMEFALRGGLLFAPGIAIEGKPFSYGRPSEGRLRRELQRLIGSPRSSTFN